MYWSYNKKTKKPGFHTSKKKISDFTGIKYDKISYELGVKEQSEMETDDFYVSKCSSVEDAMLKYSEKANPVEEKTLIGSLDISGNKTNFFLQTVND